jgi:cell division protein FtsW (lipid II flippase)
MSILAGLFLVAHGLVHLAVWVAGPPPDAPFDSRHSWLMGDAGALSRALAIAACAIFVLAGVLVIAAADLGATLAFAAAVTSLALVLLTFNRWFVFAVAINAAIIVIALG